MNIRYMYLRKSESVLQMHLGVGTDWLACQIRIWLIIHVIKSDSINILILLLLILPSQFGVRFLNLIKQSGHVALDDFPELGVPQTLSLWIYSILVIFLNNLKKKKSNMRDK